MRSRLATPGRVVDEAQHDALEEHLARQPTAEVLAGPLVVARVDPVDPVTEVRDPADATLGQRDLQVGELAQHRRPEQVRRGLHDVDRLQA